ncbi:hypothetical protein RFI_37326, partial [Reticulomyxa filosa]
TKKGKVLHPSTPQLPSIQRQHLSETEEAEGGAETAKKKDQLPTYFPRLPLAGICKGKEGEKRRKNAKHTNQSENDVGEENLQDLSLANANGTQKKKKVSFQQKKL